MAMMYQLRSSGGSGAAPGASGTMQTIGASIGSSAGSGGTVQVQLTGVLALALLAIVLVVAHKLK